MNIPVGSKVVYIGRIPNAIPVEEGDFKIIGRRPRLHEIFVVLSVLHHPESVEVGLRLVGSSVIHEPSGMEVGWNSRAFRRLDEMKAEAAAKQSIKELQPA